MAALKLISLASTQQSLFSAAPTSLVHYLTSKCDINCMHGIHFIGLWNQEELTIYWKCFWLETGKMRIQSCYQVWTPTQNKEFKASYKMLFSDALLKCASFNFYDDGITLPKHHKISWMCLSIPNAPNVSSQLSRLFFSHFCGDEQVKNISNRCCLYPPSHSGLSSKMPEQRARTKDTAGAPVLCMLSEACQ